MRDWAKRGFVGWDRGELKGYFIAGGGDVGRFESLGVLFPAACGDVKNIFLVDTPSACGGVVHYYWNQALKDAQAVVQAIDEGMFYSAGGGVSYLVSARKKAEVI